MSNSPDGRLFLAWTDRFTVGVEALDRDHHALVRLINGVCRAAHDETGAGVLAAMDSLCEAAREHFHREEIVRTFLRAVGHPAAQGAERREHRERCKHLCELRRHFEGTEERAARLKLCEELIHWFVRQSIGRDAEIKAYFDDRGSRRCRL